VSRPSVSFKRPCLNLPYLTLSYNTYLSLPSLGSEAIRFSQQTVTLRNVTLLYMTLLYLTLLSLTLLHLTLHNLPYHTIPLLPHLPYLTFAVDEGHHSLSTDISHGICAPESVFVSKAAEKTTRFIEFIVTYLLPLCMMVFCYSRVVYALRVKVGKISTLTEPTTTWRCRNSAVVVVE